MAIQIEIFLTFLDLIMKPIRIFVFSLLFLTFLQFKARAQQNSLYHFVGNLKSYSMRHDVFNAKLQNGAVKIEHLKGVGYRIRYSFTGKFQPLFSYATVDNMPADEPIKVVNKGSYLELRSGNDIVTIQKKPFRLSFSTPQGFNYLKETYGAGHRGLKIAHIVQLKKGTTYYGLGEKASSMVRNNKVFHLWNSDIPSYRMNQDPIYESYPFYIGLLDGKAFGVFYDNSFRTKFDFGGQLKTAVGYYSNGGELRFYVFYGPEIRDVLRKYTDITGRAPMPPKWAMGYQQSRWSYYPDKELYRLAYEFRSRGIPCDALYLDIDYMNGYRDFTWDKNYFPEPERMLKQLKDRGFKVVTIIDPGIKKDSTYSVYTSGLKKDVYVKYPDGSNYIGTVWPGKVTFPDFSNPVTRQWWGKWIAKDIHEGISGIWNDMDEPSVFDGKTMPNFVEFDKDGRKASADEMHNLYGLLMARASYEGFRKAEPNKRPLIITRAAFSGVQRYSSIWTGDNTARWDNVYLTMPMVMSTGLAGEPFAGFDIGGFVGSPSGEMYMRFLQIGVLMPFCRTHTEATTRAQEPWDYGQMYTYINRKFIRFRYKILPVLYTSFYESTLNGSPIIRPLVWKYQNDPKVYNIDDQFMLGDHMMAAPVDKQGMNTRTLYLPEGKWYGFFNNNVYEGGKNITVNAPIDAVNVYNKVFTHPYAGLPLFVQAGSVIPMQPVQQYVGQKKITNMTLRVYAGASQKSYLYEDDGKTQDYRKGVYRFTTFQTESSAQNLKISDTMKGTYPGAVKTFTWEIYGLADKPGSVVVDGSKVNVQYDSKSHILTFQTDAKPLSVKIRK